MTFLGVVKVVEFQLQQVLERIQFHIEKHTHGGFLS